MLNATIAIAAILALVFLAIVFIIYAGFTIWFLLTQAFELVIRTAHFIAKWDSKRIKKIYLKESK